MYITKNFWIQDQAVHMKEDMNEDETFDLYIGEGRCSDWIKIVQEQKKCSTGNNCATFQVKMGVERSDQIFSKKSCFVGE